MLGGSEILSPIESGVNRRFCSVLNVGGIRNSESLKIEVNSQFYSVLSYGGIRNSESFYNAFTLNYKRYQDQILYL